MSDSRAFALLTNDEFVAQLCNGIAMAEERVFIQVMTFDGDDAGLRVSDLLIAAAERGVDVAVTVDLFAFRYVSDTKVTEQEVAEEAAATHDMFDRMEASGVKVTYVGPWGPLLMAGAVRSHKKIFVVDQSVFLGGINVSDHNFEWFDLVVRTEDVKTVSETVDDFHATRRGERVAINSSIVTNEEVETVFDDMVSSAESSILLVSPYALDIDLEKRLAAAKAPSKTVVTQSSSNYWTLRQTDHYMAERLLRRGVKLEAFTEFFHAKFLVVDGKRVLIGSSNFGRHSFRCNQEICVVIDDEDFVAALLDVLPPTEPLDHQLSKAQYWLGCAAEYYLFTGINLLERIVVPRVPILTSR